eukprot:TRINITY_DN10594_c0_g1_i2.p1 TRINITY_DN10594_c0_g1~~TRINITY_DN10594_c0_g1_i2.p1  ORF type:complete len:339 (+),score=14.72 TRINITY_DN10594_c0_g1_i2:35-1051(+)
MFQALCLQLLFLRIVGHRIQDAQKELDHGLPGALYGIMTTNLPTYQEKVRAQLQTWAGHLPGKGRLVVVSGTGQGMPIDLGSVMFVTPCSDDFSGVTCKEERLLRLAHARQPDWFVILGEDNYVDVARLESHLKTLDTSIPKVYGTLGCEMDKHICPEAADQPSICGGGGYMLNRAAINKIMKSDRNALRDEYARGSGLQGDLMTTCILRRRGIDIAHLPGLISGRVVKEQGLRNLAATSPYTYHYLTPEAMRWLHALRMGSPANEIDTLGQKAFVHGCCCWLDTKGERECQQLHASASSLLSVWSAERTKAAEVLWEELRISHIDSLQRSRSRNGST